MAQPVTLQLRNFQGSNSTPHLLITGGVHGDEFEPMQAIRRLILHFEEEVDLKEELNGQVTFIPIVNEAAFLRGHRCAEDGLDLARVCPGDPTGTVTMQVAQLLSSQIQDADYYIDLHTGGTEFAVTPMTGYVLHENPEVLEDQRRMSRAFNLPVTWGTAPTLQGRFLSVARDANVPAIYTEYLGSATSCPAGVDAYFAGCLNVMAELGMLQCPLPESNICHSIEDGRPDSGHMQVCNPSPLTGCFEPAVTVGEIICKGESFGTVRDIIGEKSREVFAEQTGIVMTLRTYPRVQQGESLGVIVELEPS